CARAAMPPGAGLGGSMGSIVRFKGSAKVAAVADSHAPKMAPGRGFYEAWLRHSGARAFAREPGIHNHRSANMDSGLAASRRSGMTPLRGVTSYTCRPAPRRP